MFTQDKDFLSVFYDARNHTVHPNLALFSPGNVRHLLKYEEQAARDEDEAQGEGQDPALAGHDDPPIAVEAILPGENFPLSPRSPPPPLLSLLLADVMRRSRRRRRQRPRVDLLILAVLHGVLTVPLVAAAALSPESADPGPDQSSHPHPQQQQHPQHHRRRRWRWRVRRLHGANVFIPRINKNTDTRACTHTPAHTHVHGGIVHRGVAGFNTSVVCARTIIQQALSM